MCVRICLSVYKLHILLLLSVWKCWFSLVDPVFPAVPVWFSATNEPSGALTINPTSPRTRIQHPCAQPNDEASVGNNKIKMKGKVLFKFAKDKKVKKYFIII